MKGEIKMKSKEPESIGSILKDLNLIQTWDETRGKKRKYYFEHMKRGEIRKKIILFGQKSRVIQTSMKQAANRTGILITIQNHGSYLLIKRIK